MFLGGRISDCVFGAAVLGSLDVVLITFLGLALDVVCVVEMSVSPIREGGERWGSEQMLRNVVELYTEFSGSNFNDIIAERVSCKF